MTPEQFERVESLFHELEGVPEHERTALLDERCADDAEVRREVERLIGHREHVETLSPLGRDVSRIVEHAISDDLGSTIGPYRLDRRVGEGGMGVVWEATQREPVRRQVAVKLIKWGMDTREVVARFETERQSLAMMSHPGIAKVFDAGATERGRPFFAMEFVDGPSITGYCAANELGIDARLELFADVCDAIQHAHQRGIIHRDIKPSNILVEHRDGKAQPKVIDFGVAKATTQRSTERTVYTALGQLIGTPDYISPEQAESAGTEVDTRTDVYSLGVLLYELLVDERPFTGQPGEVDLDEIRRRVREDEPLRPSLRAARSKSAGVASRASRLRGDLDWIVTKALEKDPARRYASASELASDVRRHLKDLPVIAGPPATSYRLRKLVRRHRLAVGAAALVLLALVVGSSIAVIGLLRARTEARQRLIEAETASRVSEFMLELFRGSDPATARGETVTARDLLDTAAGRIEAELADQPAVQARLLTGIGTVYVNLGDYGKATPLLEKAVSVRQESLGASDPETLTAMAALADAFWYDGKYADAGTIYQDVHARRREIFGPDAAPTVETLKAIADTHWAMAAYDDARSVYEEVLAIRTRTLGPDHLLTIECLTGLAIMHAQQGDAAKAEPLFARVLEARRTTLGEDHPATFTAVTNLANVRILLERYDEAEVLLTDNLPRQQRVIGEDHVDTLKTVEALALAYRRLDRFDEAEPLLLRAVKLQRQSVGDDHPATVRLVEDLGTLYLDTDRGGQALPLFEECAGSSARILGAEHADTLRRRASLGLALHAVGRLQEARALLREVVAIQTRLLGEDHPDVQSTREVLSELEERLASPA